MSRKYSQNHLMIFNSHLLKNGSYLAGDTIIGLMHAHKQWYRPSSFGSYKCWMIAPYVDFNDLCLTSEIWSQMSELLLFNSNSAIFQLYYGENKLIFNEMMMRSALV